MKAVIHYTLTEEAQKRAIETMEKFIPKKGKLEIEVNKCPLVKEVGSLIVNNDKEKAWYSLDLSSVDEIPTEENICKILEEVKNRKEQEEKAERIFSIFYFATSFYPSKSKILENIDTLDEGKIKETLATFNEIEKIVEQYKISLHKTRTPNGYLMDLAEGMLKHNDPIAFIKEELEKVKAKVQKIEREKAHKKDRIIKDRIARGFEPEEAQKLAEAWVINKKEAFEFEKKLWAGKFGSERLKEGIDDGYNMNRIYHEERYTKEYGDGRLVSEWLDTASNPTLEALKKEKEFAYTLDDIQVAWEGKEVIQIDAPWAKKYWVVDVIEAL